MAGLVVLYAFALVLVLEGQWAHRVVRLSLMVLAVHVLELPLAFHALKGRPRQLGRVIPATLLFGALWWLPVKRGVFSAG